MRSSFFSTRSLARLSARRPWRTIGIWVLLLVLAGFAASGIGDALSTENSLTNNPESVQADDLLKERLRNGEERPAMETILVRSETSTVDDTAFKQAVEQTTADLRGLTDYVSSASNYYDAVAAGAPGAEGLVSTDRHTTIIPVVLTEGIDDATEESDAYLALIERQGGNGFEVLAAGDVSTTEAFTVIAEEDLRKGEGFGMIAALIVLAIVFGALVAAGVPLVLGIVSIVVAVGGTALVGKTMDLPFFVVNVISMIGLAVGIDYALFIIERYREERRNGLDKLAAIELAGSTASKAVLFSGLTVIFALSGMIVLPTSTFQAIGVGTILVVIAAMLTLVPALLSVLGAKIDWPRRRGGQGDRGTGGQANTQSSVLSPQSSGFWARMTRLVMARPMVSAAIAILLLIGASVPYFDLKQGEAGVETLPDSDAKTAYMIVSQEFVAHKPAPVEIVIDGGQSDPAVQAGIENLVAAIGQDAGFGPAAPAQWNATGDLALIEVPLTSDESTGQATAIERLRDEMVPSAFSGSNASVKVGGAAAGSVDFNHAVDTYTPIVFAFVLGLSFLLLMVAFRSIVVPINAILMNLLSVGAAYGLLVFVFQQGHGAGLFGFTTTPAIETWLPIFLFCILFGLSMDYHVFLLSRIKEHYDLSGNNGESVAAGLQSTAKIITGAALIMVAVFGGFASGRLVQMQQMGFGLATAVLIDATLVRSVLVPATMKLLGDRNWYLPTWLGWLPQLSIEGTPAHEPVTAPAVAPRSMPVLRGSVSGDD